MSNEEEILIIEIPLRNVCKYEGKSFNMFALFEL